MGAMTDGVDVAAQPDAADRESAIAFAFGNLRLLQQRQGAPACSDEDEFGRNSCDPTIIGVFDRHTPASIVLAVEANNLAIITNVESGPRGQVLEKQVSQRAVVDVGAGDDAG